MDRVEASAPAAGSHGDLSVVMTGGGARAAYQVGVLRSLARHHPDLRIPILTGVSAGAINAAHLASHPGHFSEKAEELASLWSSLTVDRVFKAGWWSLLTKILRVGSRLVSGGRGPQRPLKGMVDTTPLRAFLARALGSADGSLPGIKANLEKGLLRALAITASSYTTGQSVTWVQGQEIEQWERAQRKGLQCQLTLDHVMASSALPFFFPATRVDGAWYGDGGIRLTAPLSPAVHLGAGRILAISTRYERSHTEAAIPAVDGYPPPAQVAGVLLNAIFLDLLDGDAMRLERINALVRQVPPERRAGLRDVRLMVLRPSQDLGRLANEYEARLPRGFRFLSRGLGTRQTSSNDLLSLIMFQPDYLGRMMEMGEADAEARREEIAAFLGE